jgi:hypothetical protein
MHLCAKYILYYIFSTQDTYPTDPVVSEALIHMSGQFQVI